MRDHDYSSASLFLAEYFGSTTTHNVEIRALPNERGAGRAAPLFTRDPADIEVHCQRWDAIGRALYFGIATRRIGVGSGTRENLAELTALWVDIDCLKLGLDKALVALALKTKLFMAPSLIIDSGYGIHAYWLLREALDIRLEAPGAANLEADILAALKQLAGIAAGDMAVCDLARIMRLPGTHNTKQGELRRCSVLEASWQRYEWQEVQEWLDWQKPVLEAPGGSASGSGRRPTERAESNAFLKYAATAGIKPPIDVGARLAAMEYLGVGDSGIHQTQLHVSASLVRHGHADEDIVALLMAATHEAVGLAGAHWNWQREEQNVRQMIRSAREKFGHAEPAEPASEPVADSELPEAEVINLGEQRRARGRPRKDPASPTARESLIAKCGEAVIAWWRDTYGQMAVIDALAYTYANGVWISWEKGDHHTLKCGVQGVLMAAQIDPKTQLLNAVYRYVLEHPSLNFATVAWDSHGVIVCQDGTLMPQADGTWKTVAHSPDHWATSRVEVRIADMRQGCPKWLEFLGSCFSDLELVECIKVISTLQEWFGAATVKRKPRELRKALWLHGESRTGKTRILEVLRLLCGEPSCALKLKGLGQQFGPSALLGKRAWIADDAVGSADEIDDAAYKVVVTGEAFTTDVKNAAHATARLDIPVAFSSNLLPRVKDQSDGVFNRSILLQMRVVRGEEETAGKPLIEDIVRVSELAGVFAWALDGWAVLKARGRFQPPVSMRDAATAFRDANNPAMAWARVALSVNPLSMVDRRDLYASFKAWFSAEYGEGQKTPSQKSLTIALSQALPVGQHVRDGYRMMTGVKMTEIGLRLRDDCPHAFGDNVGSGRPSSDVNQPAPLRSSAGMPAMPKACE
jgi:P4 family phage/plasmid primase-like protien